MVYTHTDMREVPHESEPADDSSQTLPTCNWKENKCVIWCLLPELWVLWAAFSCIDTEVAIHSDCYEYDAVPLNEKVTVHM